MIGIQLEGDDEFLDTTPDTAIQVRLENPVFGDASALSPGSYSYPFGLPAGEKSPRNAKKLKNTDVIENNESYSMKNAKVFFDGVPMQSGKLTSKTDVEGKLSSFFTFGLNSKLDNLKTAKLRDIFLLDNYIISSSSITKTVWGKRTAAGDITVILNGVSYTAPNTALGILDLQIATFDAAQTLTLDNPDMWAPVLWPGTTPSPGGISGTFFYVKLMQFYTAGIIHSRDCTDPLIEMHVQVDDYTAYELESDLDTYFSDFQSFLAPYLDAGTYPDNAIRFPVCFNAKMHDEPLKIYEWINMVNSLGFIENDPNWGFDNADTGKVKNYNSIQPFVLLKHVLDTIADHFNFEWEGNFYTDPEVANILLWNSNPLDLPQQYIGEDKFVFWKRSFKVADLLPDVSVVDFLKAIQSRYNLAFYYNESTQKVRASYREEMTKAQAYDDITPLSSRIRNIENLRVDGYTLFINADDTDALSHRESLLIGSTSTENIEIACGRLFGSANDLIETELVSGPRVSQLMGEKGQIRIFHYKGIVHNTGYDYAAASISAVDWSEVLSDLYEKNHILWLFNQVKRLNVKIDVAFELRNLRNIDWELKRRFDRTNYIIKAIEFTLTNKGIMKSLVELYNF